MELITIVREGLWPYFLLCLVSVAMGLGLLRLFRINLPLQMALTFAPVLTTACWAVVLGIGVALRIPVHSLTNQVWKLTLGLALLGLIRALIWVHRAYGASSNSLGFAAIGLTRRLALQRRDARQLLDHGWLIATCAILPVAVMFPYFVAGLTDHPRSIFPDGWSYAAYGQYLWSYTRGAEGGLAPLYQYGAHLSHTRFIASSLLGFLSPFFSAGDTQMASGLFLAWGVFTIASSCAFFGLTQSFAAPRLLIYLVLAVFSGWVCNMLWANNYDNALALAYFPALVGAVAWLNPRSWSWRFVLGLLGAGLLYSYPELAPFILGGVLLVAIDRYWSERQLVRSWLWTVIWACGVAVALVAPYIPEMLAFIQSQAIAGLRSSQRPGEGLFGGLLRMRYQPAALWGLGSEYGLDTWLPLRNAIGFLLSIVATLGFLRLIRQRRIGFATMIVLLVATCGFFIVIQKYSYGAYKFILLVWWAVCYMLVLGLDGLLLRFRSGVLRYVTIGLCALAILLALAFNHHGVGAPSRIKSNYEHLAISQFRQLEQIKQITHGAGVFVMVDDWLANQWAVYFLRDTPIDLGEYRMYMAQPHVIPLMEQAQPVPPDETRYALTDGVFDAAVESFPGAKLVWSGGPYHLWETDIRRGATITAITNAGGVQQLDGERFFWMGQDNTTLDVFAQKRGVLHLMATFLPGPSVPDQAGRQLLVMTDAGYRSQFTLIGGDQSISLPVPAGNTKVTLRSLDKPTTTAASNGDPRPLILGVKGVVAVLDDDPATLEQVQNPYGVEPHTGEPLFWMGSAPTKIRVYALRAGQLSLQARFMPGPSLPETKLRRVLVQSDTGYLAHVSITGGEQRIELPIQPGMTTITLTVLDTPTVAKLASSDKRILLLGVKGLTVRLDP
jgi:hypothetical protein